MNWNFLWKFCFHFGIRRVPVDDLNHEIHVTVGPRDARNDVQAKVFDVGRTVRQIDVNFDLFRFRFIFVGQFELSDVPGVVSIEEDWRSGMIRRPLNDDSDSLSDVEIANADDVVSEELRQDGDFFRCKEPISDSKLGQDRQSRNVAQDVRRFVGLKWIM